MAESRHDFGAVHLIRAESFGPPGQRTFRVLVATATSAASLWMEKEWLRALGTHIEGQLGRARTLGQGRDEPAPDPSSAYRGEPSVDFRVGNLALGYDEERGIFLLLAYTPEDEERDRPTFSCRATPEQLRMLAEEIRRVVTSGRPTCPLCGVPIDPPPAVHACIRANGHRHYDIPPEQVDEET
jgi:uncharacterized repeat protein (TIGR03847 family)